MAVMELFILSLFFGFAKMTNFYISSTIKGNNFCNNR